MTDDPRERAIARARKLLTQAEHPNTSVEERQAFAAKAADIMMRHDLTEAVVRVATEPTSEAVEIDMFDFRISGSGGHGRHRAWGLGDVAEAYGCEICFSDNDAGNAPRTMHIVGVAADLDVLRMLLPTVAAAAEITAADAARRHRGTLSTQGWYTAVDLAREVAQYRRSFLRSFGAGVAAQIKTQRANLVQELASATTGAELVLASRSALISAEFTRRYPRIRKARSVRAHSKTGARDGYQAGHAMNLGSNTIGADPSRPQLPR